MKRRSFLKAGAALPALGVGLAQRDGAATRHSSFDPWVEVHAGHLRANATAVHRLTRVPILAVIKNNGYGARRRQRRAGCSSRSRTSPASPSSSCTRRSRCATPASRSRCC